MNKYQESGIGGVITWKKIIKASLHVYVWVAFQVYTWVALFIWINCCSVLGYDQTITVIAKIFRSVGGTFTSLFFMTSCLWLFNEIVHTYLEVDGEFEERVKKRRYMLFALKWLALVVFIFVGRYLSCDLPFSLMTS